MNEIKRKKIRSGDLVLVNLCLPVLFIFKKDIIVEDQDEPESGFIMKILQNTILYKKNVEIIEIIGNSYPSNSKQETNDE